MASQRRAMGSAREESSLGPWQARRCSVHAKHVGNLQLLKDSAITVASIVAQQVQHANSQGIRLDSTANVIDSFTTIMRNLRSAAMDHTGNMKYMTTGVEVDLSGKATRKTDIGRASGNKIENIKPLNCLVFLCGQGFIVFAAKRPLGPGGATGYHSLARPCSSTNQFSGQLDLLTNQQVWKGHKGDAYLLPSGFDKMIAAKDLLHLEEAHMKSQDWHAEHNAPSQCTVFVE
jgi:hypothetical protein